MNRNVLQHKHLLHVLGFLGQVHPVTAKAYDIPETYVAELNLSAIEASLQPANPFVEITK